STHETPLEEVIRSRRPGRYSLRPDEELPLPALIRSPAAIECLCLPLIGNHHLSIGVVTLECRTTALIERQIELLSVVATLLAVSLENARLFYLATVDGLTGLYARRYFEM